MAHVQLERVSKSYDGRHYAVQAMDLACHQGEMLALLGPSGCGKSSTLKMVAGIEGVSDGRILFDGVDVTRRDSAGRNVAMVFEDYALYPHLSVRENIAFPLKVRRAPAAEAARKVDEAIELLGLGPLADAGVRSLSGGAQQRVSIGRALVREPALVMFDEPLSHLDADQKVVLRTEIRRMQSTQGLTSVLVTHDQTEAMAMADRIAVMDHGVLQQVGSPEDLYRRPANRFVAGFIGETPMNFLDAVITAPGVIGLAQAPDITLAASGTPVASWPVGTAVVLGIRPEDVRLQAGPATSPSMHLPAQVIDKECAGDHDVLRLQVPAGEMHAEVDAPSPAQAGDTLTCVLPLAAIHLFDARDGRRLAGEGPAC